VATEIKEITAKRGVEVQQQQQQQQQQQK